MGSRARAANAWWRSRTWSTGRRRRRARAAAEAPPPELPDDAARESFTPDTTLLFRYSAVTYNGHRIHYDADYARGTEGYPALVVNGGITTTKLSELAEAAPAGAAAAGDDAGGAAVVRRAAGDARLPPGSAGPRAALGAGRCRAAGLRMRGGVRRDGQGSLSGVKVLDLTAVVVGPSCTLTLAEQGAEVIKLESPEGDLLRKLGGPAPSPDMSPKFIHFNRGKRSIAVDLKTAEGMAVLARLAEQADVLVTNMRGGALKRLGITWEALRPRNPRLVFCVIAGFGSRGRHHDSPAYDTIIQGMSGFAAALGRVTGEPRYAPFVLCDHITGIIASQAITAALFARERSGEGQAIEVPMYESMAHFVLTEHMFKRTFDPEGATGDPRVMNPDAKPIPTAGRLHRRLGQYRCAGLRLLRRHRPAGAARRPALQQRRRALPQRRRLFHPARRGAAAAPDRRMGGRVPPPRDPRHALSPPSRGCWRTRISGRPGCCAGKSTRPRAR